MMINEPILLLPAFRSGRDTPWAGDVLRRHYHKYTLGNQIGESYDFSVLTNLESTAPDGEQLSDILRRTGVEAHRLPFLIKWIDASGRTSLHVHPDDEYLFIVRTQSNAQLLTCAPQGHHSLNDIAELVKADTEERLFHKATLSAGDVLYLHAGLPHALDGVTAYILQHPKNESCRLYDWQRSDAKGRSRPVQTETASFPSPNHQLPVFLDANKSSPINTKDFQLHYMAIATECPLEFEGRFAVLTCLDAAVICLSSGKQLFISAGQSVYLPFPIIPCRLTGTNCLLAVSKV